MARIVEAFVTEEQREDSITVSFPQIRRKKNFTHPETNLLVPITTEQTKKASETLRHDRKLYLKKWENFCTIFNSDQNMASLSRSIKWS